MSEERAQAPTEPEPAERAAIDAKDDSDADAPVPKLPRGKGITLTRGALTRIGFTAIALVAVLVLQRPCSRAVGQFVTAFGDQPATPAEPVIAPAPTQYEVLTPSMTDDELRAAIGRAEARARQAREAPAPAPAPSPAPPPIPAAPSQP